MTSSSHTEPVLILYGLTLLPDAASFLMKEVRESTGAFAVEARMKEDGYVGTTGLHVWFWHPNAGSTIQVEYDNATYSHTNPLGEKVYQATGRRNFSSEEYTLGTDNLIRKVVGVKDGVTYTIERVPWSPLYETTLGAALVDPAPPAPPAGAPATAGTTLTTWYPCWNFWTDKESASPGGIADANPGCGGAGTWAESYASSFTGPRSSEILIRSRECCFDGHGTTTTTLLVAEGHVRGWVGSTFGPGWPYDVCTQTVAVKHYFRAFNADTGQLVAHGEYVAAESTNSIERGPGPIDTDFRAFSGGIMPMGPRYAWTYDIWVFAKANCARSYDTIDFKTTKVVQDINTEGWFDHQLHTVYVDIGA